MTTTLEQFDALLHEIEGEHLEFKECKEGWSKDKLAQYCSALANEGGGKVILGVSDRRPRRVVGTKAFPQLEEPRTHLIRQLRLAVEVEEIRHPDGRALIFHVPPRPIGKAVAFEGRYLERRGDSLADMSQERLQAIFAEAAHDFSADICMDATLADLDTPSIETFRRLWVEKSGSRQLEILTREQLLRDVEAITDAGLTYAGLILFGSRPAVQRHLAQAEVVFEYRSSEAAGPAQQRMEFRQGFFSFYEALWQAINLRNDLQHYQNGLFLLDIPTFAERPVREAVLNAVSHRDYQSAACVFVRQYPRRLVVESPGGFPHGITLENILDRQIPRNRRIADIFSRCGLVERSGQGMNLIYEQSIRQGKSLPDFAGTDANQVTLTLHGEVQDPAFVQFLERVGRETGLTFSTQDFLLLDRIHREVPVPDPLKGRVVPLLDAGVLERAGRGRFLLSRRFYTLIGLKGAYTRKRGLDKETNKTLLQRHVQENSKDGSPLKDLVQVLPALSRNQVQKLLLELKREKKIRSEGKTRAARWYPEPIAPDSSTGAQ